MPFISSHSHIKSFATFISFLLLVLMTTACTTSTQNGYDCPRPRLTSINIIDRNGMSEIISNPDRIEQYECIDFLEPQPYEKVLRIYARDYQGNITAKITSYHSNGFPSQYLEVVNSRAYGAYNEWHQNGMQKIEATVIGGTADIVDGAEKTWIFDGNTQVWNESGCIEATIPYVKGELEGVSIYYHINGNVWKSVPYCQGLINGQFEVYCIDGSLLQSYNYCMGLKEGEAVRYWPNGQIAAEELYCQNLLVTGKYYNSDGSCVASIDEGNGMRAIFGKEEICELHEYRLGQLEGKIEIYDCYGRVSKLYHVKNRCKHGEEIFYYDAVLLQKTLQPKLSINWHNGKIQGLVKTWYPNGIQESQKEMSNNKKNGHNTAWYRDGSLMLIEEYEQDKLLRGEYYTQGEKLPVSSVQDCKGMATMYDADGNFIQKINYVNGRPEIPED